MTTMTEQVKRCLDEFGNSVRLNNYDLSTPFPNHADIMLDATWALVADLSERDANVIREAVNRELAAKLLGYSRRMAVYGLRSGEEKYVLFGLYATSLDGDVLDIRDVFRAVVLHFDVCRKHGFAFAELFERGVRLATERRQDLLASQFLRGPNYTKSLKAMKYSVADTTDGTIYVDELFSWP